jgi:ZIP family zinc transporter
VLEAFLWSVVASSSLLIGALLAQRFTFSNRDLGLIMGFAAGVLISAVAYDLVLEAAGLNVPLGASAGLFGGAIAYFVGNQMISRYERKDGASVDGGEASRGLPIVLGAVLDGIPESIVLGLTLVEGSVSITLLVAIFLSNLPEALVATDGLKKSGWRQSQLLGLWGAVVLASGLASALGYAASSSAPPHWVAFMQAFAAGAVLNMLADSMMPEAFERAGNLAGLVTTVGFAVAFGLQALG